MNRWTLLKCTKSTSIRIYPNTSIIFANILKFGLWPSKLVPVAVWPLQRLYLWPWRHRNFLPNFLGVSPVVRNSWLSWRPLLKGYHHDVARSQWRYRVPIQLQSPPHGLSWSTNIIHHQKRLSQRYNCHKLMQTSRAPVDLRDPSVALQHFPHRQDSEMVNIASWRQWMPIQPEGWAQSYCGLEQNLRTHWKDATPDSQTSCYSLLTVLVRGLLEHVVECECKGPQLKFNDTSYNSLTNAQMKTRNCKPPK